MIFKYSQNNRKGKVYTFKDLDIGETFMLSDPRMENIIFEDCGIYMLTDVKSDGNYKFIDLSDGGLRSGCNADLEVYPVICECSVSLYPDVY